MTVFTIGFTNQFLNLETVEEREAYIKERVRQICTPAADKIREYLTNRRMTKKEFCERTKISKWRLNRILDGDYGGFSLVDIAAISSEFSGEKDKATRKVLVEKFKKQY